MIPFAMGTREGDPLGVVLFNVSLLIYFHPL
jgi:hypothetical protein